MKKGLVIVVSLLILTSLAAFVTYSNYLKEKNTLTGETVTGEATDINFAVAVSVIVEIPEVTLIYPENETYITTQNLKLNYSSSNTDAVWYNLDNTGNITLTGNTTFNTENRLHILYIYANNSEGTLVSDNVTFTVNLTKFKVHYEEYSNSKKGSSTDFNKSSYEDLQNLSGIILENTDWGKIKFNTAINTTEDLVKDNLLDLDTNTNISENRIELNSTALPNFNKPATLYFYGLTFSNPRILRDGNVCPSTICTGQSYSSGTGTLIFNVTQFTIYSAEETLTLSGTSDAAGGGCNYKWDCTKWNECLPYGKQKRDCINIGSCPDTYRTPETERDCEYIPPEIEEPLFDIIISTLPESEEIFPDTKEVSFQIELIKFGLPEELTKVKISYKVNTENGTIYEESEDLEVQKGISFIKIISLPELNVGTYQIDVKIEYDDKTAEGKTSFIVKEKTEEWGFLNFLKTIKGKIYLSVGILILVLIIGMIFFFKKRKDLNLKNLFKLKFRRKKRR